MEIGRAVEVLNPYDWLPKYGESAVNFFTRDGNLSVIVEYDSQNGLARKELLFKSVCSFYGAACPGPLFLPFTYSVPNDIPLGALIEYPDSEAAMAWVNHYDYPRIVKHYRILFLAASSILIVFAESVSLREAV